MMFLYVLTTLFSFCMIVWAVDEMNNDSSLSVRGNVGIAMVAAAGFSVFPLLNVVTALFLMLQLKNNVRKETP